MRFQVKTVLADVSRTDIEVLAFATKNEGLLELEETLLEHASFVRFVTGEQDSINYIFAARFDSRPWYQSILGKWEDMERERNTSATEEAP